MTDLLRTIRTGDRRWRIGLLNGPNMPNLGRREQARFGSIRSLGELEDRVGHLAEALGVELSQTFASNHEGEILDWIHSQTDSLDGLLVNPAGLTWTGEATRHALYDSGLPVIEVHFANPSLRGKLSIFGDAAVGTCQGLRKHSYSAALVAMVAMLDDDDFTHPPMYQERRAPDARD
jgi:3-dehydroquinate dehydratase-2